MKKITHEEFVEKIQNINPNIEIIGKYINSRCRIKCRCKIDGYEWNPIAKGLMNGNGCSRCSGKEKKTHSQFLNELYEKNKSIEVLGTYKNNKTKVKCKCKIDGYEWGGIPSNLLNGQGCPKCGGKIKKTHKCYINQLKKINATIEVIGEYKSAHEKVKCKCLIDGYIWESAANSLLKGQGCPKCAGKIRRNTYEFSKLVSEVNPNIEIIGEFISTKNKIKCRCKLDGHEWDKRASDLVKGSGCPKCKSQASKGEKRIMDYCDKNYIKYIQQYKFENLKHVSLLRFDFALFNKNKIIALIEYQGEQHYKPIDFAGKGEMWAKENYKSQVKKDTKKRNYCIANSIPLIEIPYWEKDVEDYLEKQLSSIKEPIQLSLV